MCKIKQGELSYEDFVKCFAGVYRKMTACEPRCIFTCYVRGAIESYVNSDIQERVEMAEEATRCGAVGVMIAKALLAQGYSANTICRNSWAMQAVVDNAELKVCAFTDALAEVYIPVPDYNGKSYNSLRLAHMLDGAPHIEHLLENDDD